MSTELATTEMHPLVAATLSTGGEITPDSLDKLLKVQKDWEANEARKAFNQAFTKMQATLPPIEKTKKGHNSKYAPYDKVVSAVRPHLKNHGFSFRHQTVESDNKITITCILAHELGHSEQSTLSAPADTSGSKNAIQAIGSTNSYLKRYTLQDVVGIVTGDEDTDGNKPPVFITEHQLADLKALIDEKGKEEAKVLDYLKAQGVNSFKEVPIVKFARLCEMVSK